MGARSRQRWRHGAILVAIIALGAFLRFGNLAVKPLWLDEIVTALMALGRGYEAVPVGVTLTPSELERLFALPPDGNCARVARLIGTQSTHPPLFFCLMHQWLQGLSSLAASLAWKLRSLPALGSLVAIAAIYALNRLAVSPRAGLAGAAAMAVSPFGIYLAQEARQYGILLALILLALVGMLQIQRDAECGRQRPLVWLGWGAINIAGCYTHYFFLLALFAQAVVLIVQLYRHPSHLAALGGTLASIGLAYWPWIPYLLQHYGDAKTGWLPEPDLLGPLYRTLAGWIVMAVMLPLERQPLGIQIASGAAMLAFAGWLAWQIAAGMRRLWRQPATRSAIQSIGGFAVAVLLQFLALIYGLERDTSVAFRYNCIYFPAFCALVGASLQAQWNQLSQYSLRRLRPRFPARTTLVVAVGIVSSLVVISDLAFAKPYLPARVTSQLERAPEPLMLAMGYRHPLGLARSLSYAWALNGAADSSETQFALFELEGDGSRIWQRVSDLSDAPQSLWVMLPDLERADYPPVLTVGARPCQRHERAYHRLMGWSVPIAYQRYSCDRGTDIRQGQSSLSAAAPWPRNWL